MSDTVWLNSANLAGILSIPQSNPKRKRGKDLAPRLRFALGVSPDWERYSSHLKKQETPFSCRSCVAMAGNSGWIVMPKHNLHGLL